MPKRYTIGELAKLTDMSTKALRIYEEKGLINSIRNEENNYRFFDESVKLQLQRIHTLKYLGFSLDEIENMLIHFNQINLEESFLEQKKLMEKKVFELNRMIHCMEKAAIECKEKEFNMDEVFKMLNHVIIDRKADEGVGFISSHTLTNEPEGWSRWILEQVPLATKMNIMDAGAGYGNLWRYNLDRIPKGVKVTCVDKHNTHADNLYEEYKDYKNHNSKLLNFVWDDLETMEFQNRYDLIFFNHTMYFIENKEALMKKFKGALSEEGRFVCTWGGVLFFEEVAKLFIEFMPDKKKQIEEGLKSRIQPVLEPINVLEKTFDTVDQRVRRLTLYYDNLDEFAGYIMDKSSLGFDVAKYEDEFKEFLKRKFPGGDYQIDRDTYLFICK